MPLSPTLPIAAAAGPLAFQVARGLTEGLSSFADLLRRGEDNGSASGVKGDADELTPPWLSKTSSLDLEGLSGVKQDTEAALERFGRAVRQRLSAAEIDTSLPIQLERNGGNGVLVGGDHPQRAFIEQALVEDPELVLAFNELMARLQLQQRLDEARYARSFRLPNTGSVQLLLSGDTATAQFG